MNRPVTITVDGNDIQAWAEATVRVQAESGYFFEEELAAMMRISRACEQAQKYWMDPSELVDERIIRGEK